MTMKHVFVFIFLVVSTAQFINGQVPLPCDPPAQFSFRVLQYDHDYFHINRFRGMYDATSQRVTFVEDETRSVPGKQFFKYIFLYNKGVSYEVNLSTKKCIQSTSGPFRPWGIPPNSTYEDVYVMGGPGESYEAVEWSDRLITKSASWVGLYTQRDCYPVMTFLYANENVNRSMKNDVFDITSGLIAPEEFIPPEECQNNNLAHGPLGHLGKSLLSMLNKKWIL